MDSNVPTVDLTTALDPGPLHSWVEWNYADHALAIDALLFRFVKFSDVTAHGIGDDYVAGVAADFAKDLKAAANALDETRARIKKPVLHAQRIIDGEAKKLTDRVTAAVSEVEKRVTAYLRVKEAEARAAAMAEATRLQAEAEQRAAEAMSNADGDEAEAAVEAFDAAEQATQLANARALELTRARGPQGALTALRDHWTYEIVALHAVPPHLLQVNDAAVRLAIKQGERLIPGLRVYNDTKAMIR